MTSMMTILSQWLLTRRDRRGWYVSLMNQGLWLTTILMTGAYGLLILTVVMTYLGIKGLRNWRKL